MRERRRLRAIAVLAVMVACGPGSQPPAIEIGTPCSFCRMAIVDPRLAAEIVAPGEEPRQYDDIGCLVNDLRKRPLTGGRAFVADYRTGALVRAGDAIYTRADAIPTPMASSLVAHADDASRDADPRVRGGPRHTAADVFAQGTLHGQ